MHSVKEELGIFNQNAQQLAVILDADLSFHEQMNIVQSLFVLLPFCLQLIYMKSCRLPVFPFSCNFASQTLA